jgi:Type II CAAX prenyl endopeptidase Rce1-like
MTGLVWSQFALLFTVSILGTAAVIPYSLRLAPNKPPRLSKPALLLLTMLQSAVLFAIAVGLGLLAAHAMGLGAPYLEAGLTGSAALQPTGLIIAFALGLVAGAVLLIADLFFVPYWPPVLRDTALKTTLLENFLASLYGGVNEELLMRLFGLSGLMWLLSFVWHTSVGGPTTTVFWIANVIMTVLFGIGHLPALKGLLATIPRLILVRSLLLNAPVGLLCGWLFWTYGIEAAIIAHFATDVVYHVIGTAILRRRLS